MEPVSVVGMLWLILFYSGNAATDLVSLVDAPDYFKARQVEVRAADLLDLAAKQPADGKTQIAQLLAIRWLGEHPDEVKNDAKARDTLEQIAAGKKAQDAHHFSQEYAQRALAKIDGKPGPKAHMVPAGSVRHEALAWFSRSSTLVGALDLRGSAELKLVDDTSIRSLLYKLLPEQGRTALYTFADAVGNIQLDRIAYSYAADPADPQTDRNSRIYLRLTGRANPQWLGDFIHKNLTGSVVKEEKGPSGEPIRTISADKNPPAFILIDDSDMIIAGPEGNGESLGLAREALEVRAGNKPSVLTGPLGDKLKKVPENACGLLLGELPAEMQRDMTRGGNPFKAVPHKLALYMVKGRTIAVHFQGTLNNAEDATAFADSFNALVKKGADALQNLPPEIKIKPDSLRLLSKSLEDLKMDARADSVSSDLELSADVVKVLHKLIIGAVEAYFPVRGSGAGASRPVPPTAVPAPPR